MPMNATGAGTGTASPTPAPAQSTAAGCCQLGAGLERPRYYPRQLITADDLTLEQEYFRAKLKRHNRLLHGWGVVCGCEVKGAKGDWMVSIAPGYVLGPQGDEIVIGECLTVDISRQRLDGNAADPCAADTDPWCAGVRADPTVGDTVYIAVAYAECLARPVRVQPAGCGCDGAQCEYSRTREGFVVRVLTADQLPDAYKSKATPLGPDACPKVGVRPCPDCVDEPWVILASIKVGGRQITDDRIDNFTYRRYVASFGGFWFTCAGPKTLTLVKVGRVRLLRDGDGTELTAFDSQQAPLPTMIGVQRSLGGFSTLEITFTGAVAAASVVLNSTFLVDDLHSNDPAAGSPTPVNGSLAVSADGLTARWRPAQGGSAVPLGVYRVRLVGTGPPAITAPDGTPLDGEALASPENIPLPSGDGTPGGNFVFQINVF